MVTKGTAKSAGRGRGLGWRKLKEQWRLRDWMPQTGPLCRAQEELGSEGDGPLWILSRCPSWWRDGRAQGSWSGGPLEGHWQVCWGYREVQKPGTEEHGRDQGHTLDTGLAHVWRCDSRGRNQQRPKAWAAGPGSSGNGHQGAGKRTWCPKDRAASGIWELGQRLRAGGESRELG